MVYKIDFTDKEVWKTVELVGHAGDFSMYEVSNLGRVRSKDRIIERSGGGTYERYGQILKPFLCSRGFMTLTLVDLSSRSKLTTRVHRIVADVFLPREPNKPHILFVDGDHRNCRVNNLMRVTRVNKNNSYIP